MAKIITQLETILTSSKNIKLAKPNQGVRLVQECKVMPQTGPS